MADEPTAPAAEQPVTTETVACDPVAEAKKLIEDDKTIRAEACGKEIEVILKKYNCELKVTQSPVGINAL